MPQFPLKFCLLVLLAAPEVLQAMDFEIVGDSTSFFEPCESVDHRGNKNITDMFDFSQLSNEDAGDGETVYTSGAVIVKGNVADNMPIRLEIVVLRWKYGQWMPTMYAMRRDDFCKIAFGATELWHDFIMNIPSQQRQCPPKAGILYSFHNASNRVILRDMPPTTLPGLYKAVVHLSTEAYATCIAARINIYRI